LKNQKRLTYKKSKKLGGNNMKAVSLFSGGLDSILSVELILRQGIEVIAFHFVLPFYDSKEEKQLRAVVTAREMGIETEIFQSGRDYLEMLKNPKHGYGKNMNPCIDCKIFILGRAKLFMEKIEASFLFSGEVLGQRPMSQRKKIMNLIEKEAGVEGLLVRPLSAQLLEPTIPEQKGWIDRDKLLDIQGRGRKSQIELAREFGIKEYPSPAGGCCLTDPQFSAKLKDVFTHNEETIPELRLLRVGRHFRLKSGTKLIVGRNEKENQIIENLAGNDDFLIEGADFASPLVLLRNSKTPEDIEIASSICVRYSKKKESKSAKVIVRTKKEKFAEKEVAPLGREDVESLLIR
jgi:tRNA-specific 2-thiouridylase